MRLSKFKILGIILILIAICGLIWWTYSAKEQVYQMEKDIGNHYFYANLLLSNTVNELLEWDFSQPLTENVEDKDYLYKLLAELDYTTSLMFSEGVVHHEWRSKINDILVYLHIYLTNAFI